MKPFIAWMCPKCHTWQVSMIRGISNDQPETIRIAILQRKVLRCRKCGKTVKLKKKNHYGLSVEAVFFDTEREASIYVKRMMEGLRKWK